MSDDSLLDAILDDCREKMAKAVSHAQVEFAGVRTGRANPAMVEKLKVDYYGTEVPLQQIAGFTVPEPRVSLPRTRSTAVWVSWSRDSTATVVRYDAVTGPTLTRISSDRNSTSTMSPSDS